MAKTVQAFNAITGCRHYDRRGLADDGHRAETGSRVPDPGKPHVDSLEDGPAYLALMAEEMLSGGVSEAESPAPEPAPPADSPKLAVGQVWKDRLGREVTILSSDDHHTYPFEKVATTVRI